jgi:hypothetical protein
MAHQAHVLPWQTIADHFKFVYKHKTYHKRTNLYPCFKPGQGKQLQHFARVFARHVNDASTQERKQYPEELLPPEHEEVFIPDSTVKRIAKTVKWYKTIWPGDKLSKAERILPYWLDSFEAIRTTWPLHEVRQSMDLFKTLILYGELEPLLRLAVHPRVRLPALDPYPIGSSADFGWTDIKNSALIAYICLNMFVVKPELYDPTSRTQKLGEMKQKFGLAYSEEMFDYRNTSSYQKLLTHVTYTRWDIDFGVCALPHRHFFGIDKDMITTPYGSQLVRDRIGMGPPSQLFDARYRSWYVPTASDVSKVLYLLQMRVPTELALEIMDFADYTAKRRTPVLNDPLHAENAEELKKYLAYCWKLLVRVDMLIKASGQWVDWEYEVTEVINDLWGVAHPRMSVTYTTLRYSGRTEGEIDPHRIRRSFII